MLREEAAVRISCDINSVQAAPLLCAGVTVFNGIRNMRITPGGTVAILGMGGLGHLAVQYARKMGYRTVALSSGDAKRALSVELGAHEYIDTKAGGAVERLLALGGADLIVATAPSSKLITEMVGGLATRGKLLAVAPPVGPIEVDIMQLIGKGSSVEGWSAGHALDCEEAIEFAQIHGVKAWIEEFPFAKLPEAMDRIMSGNVRFKAVLTME
jgi:D-arabinose 1-dehydrogenase-like Zn-dependent alcohol dehydrogenase